MAIPLTVALMTYNRAHYLRESLSAIINQTYRDFELLVLDNGSIDDTPQVVLSFNDERIRYIRNPPGYTARFNGLSAIWIARGERLLVTHDDDIMEPDMLEQQMALLAVRPDITAIWTNQSVIDESGVVIQSHLSAPGDTRIYERGEYIARMAEEDLWHPPSSLIFTRSLLSMSRIHYHYLDRAGTSGSRDRLVTAGNGDHILPATMNLKGAVAFLDRPLMKYRKHTQQETQHVHLSHGVLNRFKTLRRFICKTDFRDEYKPVFETQIIRFKAQELVLQVEIHPLNRVAIRRLRVLLEKGAGKFEASVRAGYPLLPLAILSMQLNITEPAYKIVDALAVPAAASRAVRSFYQWAMLKREGKSIFPSHGGKTVGGVGAAGNIVLLGSVFVSALLVHDARQSGINVLCCLDSNITRQGRTWLGLPIVPHAWLASCAQPIDMIVLSAERDHEDELVKIIRKYDAVTPIVSWKELVEAAI